MKNFEVESELFYSDSINLNHIPMLRLELSKKTMKNVVYATSVTFHDSTYDALKSITAFYGSLTNDILTDLNLFTTHNHELSRAEFFITAVNPEAI